jgi:predicted DNA-binding protein (MmcQ/YjbR family)
MTDWTQEEDEAFNDVEKHSNLGKQILREIGQPYHFARREWVSLTDEDEIDWDGGDLKSLAKAIEAKLREKNEKT